MKITISNNHIQILYIVSMTQGSDALSYWGREHEATFSLEELRKPFEEMSFGTMSKLLDCANNLPVDEYREGELRTRHERNSSIDKLLYGKEPEPFEAWVRHYFWTDIELSRIKQLLAEINLG